MKELTPFPTAKAVPSGQPSQAPAPPPQAELEVTRLVDPDSLDAETSTWRAKLEVTSGSANVGVVPLGCDPLRIGRAAANDLVLADDLASRSHAEVVFESGRYVIHDLDSSNGVHVNGARTRSAQLSSGDRIVLGGTMLRFIQPEPEITSEVRLALLARSELIAPLAEATRRELAAAMRPRFVPRRACVLAAGEPLDGMLLVHRGRVRVVEVNEEGGERLVARLASGDRFGERALVAGGASPHTLIADVDTCVLELRRDAFERVLKRKPEDSQQVVNAVRSKLRTAQTGAAAAAPQHGGVEELVAPTEVTIIGEDSKVRRAKEKIEALARADATVLLVGPPGSGKKTFARHCHRSGPRAAKPYVEVSISELEPGAVGAAIFGVEADQDAAHMQGRTGYLEMIADGTLAIAHADLLDPHQQALLATYLKLGWFHRLYGQHSVRSATRIVFLATGDAATVLGGMIPELRELLAPSTVELPPLTLRLKDIPLLASHFLHHHAARVGKRALGLSREAVDRLVSYAWPGNVTELENVMQRAAIVAREDDIIPADLIFVAPPEKDVHKINLLRNEKVRAFLRRPRLMQTFIWINIGIVALVTAYTLWGGIVPAGSPLQDAATNPGMLITWLIWFPLLPVSAFLIGRIWCGMCPIAGIGDLVARIKRYSLPVPKLLKRADFWLLAGAFIVVDYIEEVAGIADRPFATAVFLLLIVYLAAAFTVLFERKAFCRYLCPLAGVLGAYSTMSLVEVRGNKKVCQTQCGEHTCFKGTKEVEGCPLSSYPASMATNAECMMCGNCLRSCEHRGVQVNLRPPLQELWRNPQPTLALSLFGVVLVGLMAKHQFPKLASWQATQARLGWSDGAAHTILFLLFLVVTLVAFAVSASLSAAASQEKPLHNMARYGIAFIPLAFSGHVAHLTHEFLDEGIYDLLGYLGRVWGAVTRGAAIGAQAVTIPRFVNPSVLTFIKFLLVSGGFLGTLIALVMIGRKASAVAVGPRVLPHVLLAVAAWVCYLAIFTGTTGEVGGAAAPVAGIVQHLAGAGGP